MKKLLVIALAAFAALMVGLIGGGSPASAKTEKVTICHATSSAKNPYVMITISAKGWDGQGKNDHTHHQGDQLAQNGTCPDGSGPGGGNEDKVDVCHVTGNGSFHVINISENAVQAHLNHGDSLAVDGKCESDEEEPPPPTKTEDPAKAPASATVTETAASVQGAAPQAARVCTSRRSFRIRIRSKRRDPVTSATVSVNGKRVASRKGSRVTAPVVLRGLAKGTYAVKITATTRRGRKLSGTRRYKTCAPKAKRQTIPLL